MLTFKSNAEIEVLRKIVLYSLFGQSSLPPKEEIELDGDEKLIEAHRKILDKLGINA